MRLEIQKIYNLPRHSFLLLLCVTDLDDPCVFVVKDLAGSVTLEEGSSGSLEEPSEISVGFPEGETSSSSDGSISVEEDEEVSTCVVDPHRALVAIASLEDMLYAPKGPSDPGELYRASVVSMLFKSKEALEQTLEEIIADLRILAVLLDIPVISFEERTFEDDNDTVDENRVYWMPDI